MNDDEHEESGGSSSKCAIVIGCSCKGSVKKVANQLREMGIRVPEHCLRYGEQKIRLPFSSLTSKEAEVLKYTEKVTLEVLSNVVESEDDITSLLSQITTHSWDDVLCKWCAWNECSPSGWTFSNKIKKGFTHTIRCDIGNRIRTSLSDSLQAVGCNLVESSKRQQVNHVDVHLVRSSETRVVSLQLLLLVKKGSPFGVVKGLHHSLCWGMGTVANISPGDIVCDPCCGKGNLLLECGAWFAAGGYFGFDNNPSQVTVSVRNITAMGLENTMSVVESDSSVHIPLRSDSVDVVISDLPFGRKYGTSSTNTTLYPPLIREISRIMTAGGRGVLLTAVSQLDLLSSCLEEVSLALVRSSQFQFGGGASTNTNRCVICCVQKVSADGVCPSADTFNLDHLRHLSDGSSNIGWMNVKPSMVRP